jgi:hypothetical protein
MYNVVFLSVICPYNLIEDLTADDLNESIYDAVLFFCK